MKTAVTGLRRLANPKVRIGMTRYGLPFAKALGVSVEVRPVADCSPVLPDVRGRAPETRGRAGSGGRSTSPAGPASGGRGGGRF